MVEIQLLLLLLIANGAPIIAFLLLKERWAFPLDRGRVLRDGQRLLGKSCTLRGWLASAAATALAAIILDIPLETGLVLALLAMTGDALSSFVKRRLRLAPGHRAPGLDQVPESLLPLIGVSHHFDLSAMDIGLIVTGFFLLDVLLSPILYWLKLRKDPH